METCRQTVPEAFTAFLEGTDFEDVIRTAVSLGGDCDTLTGIAGSMAEAMYGVPLRFGLHSVDTEDGKRWLVVFTSGEEYEKGESASTMVETVKRMLGGCEVGEAKITAGYDLKAEYVIHRVSSNLHRRLRLSATGSSGGRPAHRLCMAERQPKLRHGGGHELLRPENQAVLSKRNRCLCAGKGVKMRTIRVTGNR